MRNVSDKIFRVRVTVIVCKVEGGIHLHCPHYQCPNLFVALYVTMKGATSSNEPLPVCSSLSCIVEKSQLGVEVFNT